MDSTRKTRTKRVKLKDDFESSTKIAGDEQYELESPLSNDPDDKDEVRKFRIRESNKEFAKRMTILQAWSEYWSDYTIREGEAYPQQQAREIIKTKKKIACPINSCGKTFTSIGGLKYHYARCNIAKTFSCKNCNPPVESSTRGELLRHMILSHLNELPALNSEQQEIVHSYVRCENRSDRKRSDRRLAVISDTELPLSGQRAIRAFADLHQRLIISSKVSPKRYYDDWSLFSKDWEEIVSPQSTSYFPPEPNSVKLKVGNTNEWNTLSIGSSKVLCEESSKVPTSFVFFTGGVNTAVAWLPQPTLEPIESELVAIAVDCCSMNATQTYKASHYSTGCIQFWSLESKLPGSQSISSVKLSFMVGHEYGRVYDMSWCPIGTSWQSKDAIIGTNHELPRVGLLAIACADGQIRILSVPHTSSLLANSHQGSTTNFKQIQIFKVKPVATLIAPGVGPSTDSQPTVCKCLCWDMSKNQNLIFAGYGNGNVAMFDLSNLSPFIFYIDQDKQRFYHPLKSWAAHGAAVTGVAISNSDSNSLLVATASIDRQVKIWNSFDLNSCVSMDRAPLTRLVWDYRARGVITASDSAFTGFNNRVLYRYPTMDGSQGTTVSTHRSTVWGLSNSLVTGAIATSDAAGEVFVTPVLNCRSNQKRDRHPPCNHSLYSMIPIALSDQDKLRNTVKRKEEDGEMIVDDLRAASTVPSVDESELNESCLDVEADFSVTERQIINKPTKFLLPIEHKPVTTYHEFEKKFGIEFLTDDSKQVLCDRNCDYPFCSVNNVAWSPNFGSFPQLLSLTQIGFCRLDKVKLK